MFYKKISSVKLILFLLFAFCLLPFDFSFFGLVEADHIPKNIGGIYKITPEGKVKLMTEQLEDPTGLAFNNKEELYVTEPSSGSIYRINSKGEAVSFLSNLVNPTGITFNQKDELFITASGIIAGHEVAAEGIFKVGPRKDIEPITIGLNAPYTLIFDPQGNLYASNFGNHLISILHTSRIATTLPFTCLNPSGMAFDKQGNLFVASFGNNGIIKITPDKQASVFVEDIQTPTGLVVDKDGNLFVASLKGNEIFKITPEGKPVSFAKGIIRPKGIVLDKAGNLYVTGLKAMGQEL
jgi:DNA-binding beta-propeller fold protein YncE